MLTQDDYDPALGHDSPRPDDRGVRILLSCWPSLKYEGPRHVAVEFADALDALDVDAADVAAERLQDGTDPDQYPAPDDRPEYHTAFDADHTYQYEYAEDTATIELAAHADTEWREPMIRWRVTADPGVVAGDHARFTQSDHHSLPLLDIHVGVEHGSDPEQPVIAAHRFPHLPVPREVAADLRGTLEQLRTLTPAGDDLETDPNAFPDEITTPDDSPLSPLEIVGWDSTRNIMWYDESDTEAPKPHACQIEDGTLINRDVLPGEQIDANRYTWQDFIDGHDLELVAESP